MKFLKITEIMIILISVLFALNSCNCIPAYRYISLRYDGRYTGIDTLISVDGYYNFQESTSTSNTVTFYRDGSLTSHFSITRSSFTAMDGKTFKQSLETGFLTDSILINNCDGFGLYTIANDTIKSQVIYYYGSMGAGGVIERWYKIISKDKLLVIKYENLQDKSSEQLYNNKELQFYPAWRPDSTDNWLRDCLREKGAGK